jgi:hypothetical protein
MLDCWAAIRLEGLSRPDENKVQTEYSPMVDEGFDTCQLERMTCSFTR